MYLLTVCEYVFNLKMTTRPLLFYLSLMFLLKVCCLTARMSAAQVLTDFENLPDHVKDKLAELDLELSEGRQCCIVYIFSSMDFQRDGYVQLPRNC